MNALSGVNVLEGTKHHMKITRSYLQKPGLSTINLVINTANFILSGLKRRISTSLLGVSNICP